MQRLGKKTFDFILFMPVNVKIAGIMMLPVLILGFSLNYWVTSGLADWLSYLLTDVRVEAAMMAGRRTTAPTTRPKRYSLRHRRYSNRASPFGSAAPAPPPCAGPLSGMAGSSAPSTNNR